MKELPDKPSELIRLALKDLEKIEGDDRYAVNMGTWHNSGENKCIVCLAGAVMACELGVPADMDSGPEDFLDEEERKLLALEDFRVGAIHFALTNSLGIPHPEGVPYTKQMHPYFGSQEEFKADMRAIADMLEEHGL